MEEKDLEAFNDYLQKNPNATADDIFKTFPSFKGDKEMLKSAYGYVHGLSQGNSPRRLKTYFPELFTTPPTEHDKMMMDAENTLNSTYAQHGGKAIDVLNQHKSDQSFYDSHREAAAGQDATYLPHMAPKMLQEDVDAQRKDYLKANPNPTNDVIKQIAYQNPDIKPQLDQARFLHNRQNDPNKDKVVKVAKQIGNGDVVYDADHDKLIKPLGPLDSIAYGWDKRHESLNGYDFITSHSDDDVINHFNQKAAKHDPNEAQDTPNWNTLSGIGSEGTPMLAMTEGDLLTGATKIPAFAAAGQAYALHDYYKRDLYDNTERIYWENKNKGVPDKDALKIAKQSAQTEANVGIAKNATMFGAISRLGGATKALADEGTKNLVRDFTKNLSSYTKRALQEGTIVGGVSAAGQVEQNSEEKKPGGQGTLEAFTEGGISTIALGTVIHGIMGAAGITGKALRSAKQYLTKVDPATVNADLGEMIKDKSITPDQAKQAEKEIADHKALDSQIPEDVTDDHARMDIQDKIERKQELEETSKNLNSAYKPEFKERIAKLDEEINQKTEDAKAEQRKQKQFTKAADETEPLLEARHAESEHDAGKRVSGQSMEPLSEKGKTSAAELGEDLADHNVSKIISSDLTRAKQTADIAGEKAGVPVETRPELRSWDLGEFSGDDEKEFKKAQEFFVKNPEAKEFEGKKIGESFGEYKDRVIDTRKKLNEENPDALVINHSNNINVWDAYKKNGEEWNEKAEKDYLNAKSPEPAKIRGREPMEDYVADHFEKDVPEEELAKKVRKAVKNVKTNEQPVEPVSESTEPKTRNSEADGAPGLRAETQSDEASVPPVDKGEGSAKPVSEDRGAADETRISKPDVKLELPKEKEWAKLDDPTTRGKFLEKYKSLKDIVNCIWLTI